MLLETAWKMTQRQAATPAVGDVCLCVCVCVALCCLMPLPVVSCPSVQLLQFVALYCLPGGQLPFAPQCF